MNDKNENQAPPVDENRLIAERRAKLEALREAGPAFPNDFRPDTHAADLHEQFGDADDEALESVDGTFAVAGRMMAKRLMGKIAVRHARSKTPAEPFNWYLQKNALPEGVYDAF